MTIRNARDRDWRDDAECAGVTPELWFPVNDETASPAKTAQAYAPATGYCWTCSVRAECLDAALAEEAGARSSLRHGMRGGMTPRERHALAVSRGLAAPRSRTTVLEEAS